MSASSFSLSKPGFKPRAGSGSGSPQREPSLIEMMSLEGWRSFIPETLGLLAAILAARAAFPNLPNGLGNMPHPLWIPVVLMSGQYGIIGGLFATLSATAGFFFGGLPPRSALQDFYDYAGLVAAQPCAWFATALLLGGLRSLHIHHHTALQQRFDQTGMAAEDLANGLESAVKEIERLEQRIAADFSSVTCLLDSFAKLDLSTRHSLVASFADIIRYGVGATSFAVYLKGRGGLEPCLGVEDGLRLNPAAVAPLSRASIGEIDNAGTAILPTAKTAVLGDGRYLTPICMPGTTELIGVAVCHRLQPSQAPEIAIRRLDDVSRVLAVMLAACRDAVPGPPQLHRP